MKKLFIALLSLTVALPTLAKTYSLSYINLGYGKLDVSSGGGDLFASVDKENRLTELEIDVSAGMFGINEHVQHSIKIEELLKLKTLSFYTSGSLEPILKLTPQAGFSADGGKIKVSVRKKDGFYYQMVELTRGIKSGHFYLWNEDSIVEEIAINVRGYSADSMFVGWYELVTND